MVTARPILILILAQENGYIAVNNQEITPHFFAREYLVGYGWYFEEQEENVMHRFGFERDPTILKKIVSQRNEKAKFLESQGEDISDYIHDIFTSVGNYCHNPQTGDKGYLFRVNDGQLTRLDSQGIKYKYLNRD